MSKHDAANSRKLRSKEYHERKIIRAVSRKETPRDKLKRVLKSGKARQ